MDDASAFAPPRRAPAGVAAALALLAACAAARARPPSDADALAAAAARDLADGRAREAQEGFEAALSLRPALYPALRGRVEAAQRAGTLPRIRAEAEGRTSSPAGAADGLAWYTLGLARFAEGEIDAGAAAFDRAASLRPGDADPQFRLGLALLESGRTAQARAPLARAVELAPRVARYRAPYGSCLGALGERKAALAALRDVPDLHPSADEARLAVRASRALSDPFRGVPAAAREDLERSLGFLLRDAPALAVPPLEQLLERAPALAVAHALRGLAAVRLDEAARAGSELSRAVELDPDAPQPHVYLAELYAARDRPEQAAAEYALALERDPLDVVTLRKLGELRLDLLGRPREALEPLSRAAALVPATDPVQLLLARAELASGAGAEGRARLQRLSEERPLDPDVLFRLAAALYDERSQASPARRQELDVRVLALLDRVLALQPGNAAATRLRDALRGG